MNTRDRLALEQGNPKGRPPTTRDAILGALHPKRWTTLQQLHDRLPHLTERALASGIVRLRRLNLIESNRLHARDDVYPDYYIAAYRLA